MKTVISVASALACAFSSEAQITTTLNLLPGRMDEVRIRNNFGTSLVAFAVAGKRAARSPGSLGEALRNTGRAVEAAVNVQFVMYCDPVIEPSATALHPGE